MRTTRLSIAAIVGASQVRGSTALTGNRCTGTVTA